MVWEKSPERGVALWQVPQWFQASGGESCWRVVQRLMQICCLRWYQVEWVEELDEDDDWTSAWRGHNRLRHSQSSWYWNGFSERPLTIPSVVDQHGNGYIEWSSCLTAPTICPFVDDMLFIPGTSHVACGASRTHAASSHTFCCLQSVQDCHEQGEKFVLVGPWNMGW